MAADITISSNSVEAGGPRQLFATPAVPWSVTPDGQRFLVSLPPPGDLPTPITMNLRWETAIGK
jgi:hypothetical protein